ncbi:MAG: bifunctional 3-deoxy-7-phosphoheptulonate synthase/chorismate mutase type II [Chitinophagales bacterium]|nr:bifunctional 3-deoxy-7-phosphoheptulonate synthase/chorismate mutase type II [Chitinophagales bacterium]MCZ2393109.1 bifunctional 3-deoxy-7-phosphoheptulonate synthase/chorismate mutase type II [Chitinophagales bacterium]
MGELNIAPLSSWGLPDKRPLIISGPCSAESEEQVIETAQRLADKGIDVLRAGIWKPRTRPGSFEGLGKIALPWLKKAGAIIGKPIAVEVATREHVFDCLKAGVDILWIGARTTANPFSVQEIADALEGVDIPVIVKNPVNPDLQLWIGALERINRAGITKIGALHRGFSSYDKSKYRNKPMWEFPIELKRLYPNLPLFNDPSHICGNREHLASVAQKALDLDFDGLMLESHRDPDNAWSDASQQVTPEGLGEIVKGLVIRNADPNIVANRLDELRSQIDRIDNYILEILVDRMDIVEKIGEFKRDNNITILQSGRWDEIVHDRVQKGLKKGLTEDFIKDLFEAVHQESIRHQTKVMNA